MRGQPVGEVEKLVLMRVGRREILSARNGPRLTVIISEHALRERIGGRAVMAGQLRKVTELADHTQLRLARSYTENHRHPWEKPNPEPQRLSPARIRRRQ
ncbi:Scr1 family TA system antitoxin-like transcriptional regulator [Saccharopolyspora pogona]|uniref:Scr1 family TA system antitoxin-like transcriptional regulator n=1 Tax=Saccharopolyspora pogona TaxID=333966 RepID=UPI0016896376|nr:Scr1 family TA system antitoxin-like transcriptional regulator [Saccharopolyspora pogona]